MNSKIKFNESENTIRLAKLNSNNNTTTIVLVNPNELKNSGYVTVVYTDYSLYKLGEILEVTSSDLLSFSGEVTLSE